LTSQYDPSRRYTLDERVALLGQIALESTPGAVENYSNTGYYLLGLLIERVSGQSYFDFLQSRIFLPLGMRSAGLVTTTPPDMAAGYLWDDGKLLRADMLFATEEGGYGGLQMTASDLAKWDAALDTEQYLSKRSRDLMWTPAVLNDGSTAPYGFGWALDSINGHPFVWHNGQVPGFHSQYERHTSDGLSVIVLTNQTDGAPEKIAAAITAMVNPALDWQIVADPRPQVGALARGVVDDIVAGTFHAERYTAAAAADLNAGLYQAYIEAARGAGAVEQVGLIDSSVVDGVSSYRYRVKTRYDAVMMVFQLDANGRISLLRLI
jgi:CubicO group peptidase (beta-lactamase class C family)